MNNILRSVAIMTLATLGAGALRSEDIPREDLRKALEDHPDLLVEALVKALQKAIPDPAKPAPVVKPAFDGRTRFRGPMAANFTLVAYSDFQCPFCGRAFQTVQDLMKAHPSDLRLVFKHLPLAFHPQALAAAQWFEAVALQAPEKAWAFHDTLFRNQAKLGVAFFRQTVHDLGLDTVRAEKDAAGPEVRARIAADLAEAHQFGFNGTPTFVLNQATIVGAQPIEAFEALMAKGLAP